VRDVDGVSTSSQWSFCHKEICQAGKVADTVRSTDDCISCVYKLLTTKSILQRIQAFCFRTKKNLPVQRQSLEV